MKKLRKLIRLLLEDVNEDNQTKEVVSEQFKYQSFDEIVIEFHRDNVVSTLVTKILDCLLFIIMVIALILAFTGLVIQFESTFSVLFSFKIRRAENFFLYYVIAFVTWFFTVYCIIYFKSKFVFKIMNVESHANLMKHRYEWIYKKFQTQELSKYIRLFSTHQTELFVLKDVSGFIKMCLNNKALEILIFGAVTLIL